MLHLLVGLHLSTHTANLHEFTMSACPADMDLEIEIPRSYDVEKI